MKGWFDAFRYDGGPTLYSFNNRTAVTGDISLITFLTIFCTLYVAFIIIFPGIRKERCTTFFAVSLSLFVGATILVTLFGSAWHTASGHVISTYRAFSTEKISSNLGVYIGLNHVNITLQSHRIVTGNNSDVISDSNLTIIHNQYETSLIGDVDFNEQFYWLNSDQMGNSFKEALVRGLPYPILTVAEYFTMGSEGLAWGGQYRAAGYYAIIMLWTSFAVWVLMNLMLIVVPRYGAVLMTTCGFLLLCTACGYFGLLPEAPLSITIDGTTLFFRFGWCYWLVLISGVTCLLSGTIITMIEIIYPHSFSTILEVDYDTPYDRHIIIEDSRGKRYQKKRASGGRLEEGGGGVGAGENVSIGGKILRRLNSRNKIEEGVGMVERGNWSYPKAQDNASANLRSLPSVHLGLGANRQSQESKNIQEVSMW